VLVAESLHNVAEPLRSTAPVTATAADDSNKNSDSCTAACTFTPAIQQAHTGTYSAANTLIAAADAKETGSLVADQEVAAAAAPMQGNSGTSDWPLAAIETTPHAAAAGGVAAAVAMTAATTAANATGGRDTITAPPPPTCSRYKEELLGAHMRQADSEVFLFKSFMIDKSATEISAVGQILQRMWHLCLFHMLQDWERFLKASDSGVKSKSDRVEILHALKRLSEIRDRQIFAAESAKFLCTYASLPRVTAQYKKNWEEIAEHWAQFGRVDIADLRCNTNNYLERFFGTFKYIFCNRKRCSRLSDLVQIIMRDVIPHYIRDRMKKEAGLITGKFTGARAAHEYNVKYLHQSGSIEVYTSDISSLCRCLKEIFCFKAMHLLTSPWVNVYKSQHS